MEAHNDTKTRLMTLLNVSHLRSTKRKLPESTLGQASEKRVKLNQKRVLVNASGPVSDDTPAVTPSNDEAADTNVEEEDVDLEDDDERDPFIRHFGPSSSLLTDEARKQADGALWKTRIANGANLGGSKAVQLELEANASTLSAESPSINSLLSPKLVPVNKNEHTSTLSDLRTLRTSLLEHTLAAKDLYIPHIRLNEHSTVRNSLSLVLLNHILKIRRKVLKNNDRIASAASKSPAQDPPEDVQDQGFTRPSTLILVPFRNTALAFLQAFVDHFTASISQPGSGSGSGGKGEGAKKKKEKTQEAQVHHYARFIAQYSLPSGALDKLASAEPGTYPPDHVATFSGNIDDNFKIGVKVTKRSVRMFEAFYGADLIVASPLGLRLAIEKEGNADFLSSIEIVVVDQIDSMLMQNWDHVQFVFSQMNKIPKDSHGADFSRIKPWFLDEHAAYLRQTILLSQYDAPEARALFNSLKNVAGKTRSVARYESVGVPEGFEQKFVKFEASSARDEPERRFEYFTKKLFPATLRSAMQSSNTVIFVPSYFDFVRVQNWMIKNSTSCAFLSEYSSNQEISRARQAFFSGSKPFLLITERFHFFRRYRLRGVRNILFYAPPEHAQFYSELLSFPFLDDGVDASDVSVEVIYSKYDVMRLERIVGTDGVGALMD